jgi:hypothetical protein
VSGPRVCSKISEQMMARRRRSGVRVWMRTGSGGISMPIEKLSPGTQRLVFLNTFLNSLSRLGSVGKLLAGIIALVALPLVALSWLVRTAFGLVALPFRAIGYVSRAVPAPAARKREVAPPDAPAKLSDAERTAILIGRHQDIERRIMTLRCPEHDKAPSLTTEIVRVGEMKLSIGTCCDSFKEQINRFLATIETP